MNTIILNQIYENYFIEDLSRIKFKIYNKMILLSLLNKHTFKEQFFITSNYKYIDVWYRNIRHRNIIVNKYVTTMASYNSECLLCGFKDGSIKLYNIKTTKCMFSINAHKNKVKAILVMCSDIIVSGGSDHVIKVWNILKKTLLKELIGHSTPIRILIKLSNYIIASSGCGEEIKLWNMISSSNEISLKHHDEITCMIKLNDYILIAGDLSSKIILWNFRTGMLIRRFSNNDHSIENLVKINDSTFASINGDIYLGIQWDL